MLHNIHTVNLYWYLVDMYVHCSWMEEDPGEILSSVLKCIQITCEKCVKKGIDINRIKGGSIKLNIRACIIKFVLD